MKLRQLISRAFAVAFVAYHAILLFERIADASILEPAVLAKWVASALLLSAAFMLRSVAASRRGLLIFWLLVLVLHVPVEHVDAELIAQIALVLGVVLIGFAVQTRNTRAVPARTPTPLPARRIAARMLIPPRCPPIR